jgi:hypothetical protein
MSYTSASRGKAAFKAARVPSTKPTARRVTPRQTAEFVDAEAEEEGAGGADDAEGDDDEPTASDEEFIDNSGANDPGSPTVYRAPAAQSSPAEGAHRRAKAGVPRRQVQPDAETAVYPFAPPSIPQPPNAGGAPTDALGQWAATAGKARVYYDDDGMLRHKVVNCNCIDATGKQGTSAKVFKMPDFSAKAPQMAGKIVCACANNVFNGAKGCGLFISEARAMQVATRGMDMSTAFRAAARCLKEAKPSAFETSNKKEVVAQRAAAVNYLYQLAKSADPPRAQ